MAIILMNASTAEREYLTSLLLREAAEVALDPDLAGLHRRVLLLLCAVVEGKPFILLDAGVTFLLYVLARADKEKGGSEESRAIIAKLMPCASEVEA